MAQRKVKALMAQRKDKANLSAAVAADPLAEAEPDPPLRALGAMDTTTVADRQKPSKLWQRRKVMWPNGE